MDCNDVKPGMTIITGELGDTRGFLVRQDYLKNRRSGARGLVGTYVPGHGGDVWWVRHEDGTDAVYMFTEMEPNVSPSTSKNEKPMKAYRVDFDEFNWVFLDPSGTLMPVEIKLKALRAMYSHASSSDIESWVYRTKLRELTVYDGCVLSGRELGMS